jgi:hypothetical protein
MPERERQRVLDLTRPRGNGLGNDLNVAGGAAPLEAAEKAGRAC